MVVVIVELIERLRAEVSGQVSDRGRVIDNLLDLRAAAEAHPDLVERIDHHLSELPGQTVVENSWWSAALDDLAARGAIAAVS